MLYFLLKAGIRPAVLCSCGSRQGLCKTRRAGVARSTYSFKIRSRAGGETNAREIQTQVRPRNLGMRGEVI